MNALVKPPRPEEMLTVERARDMLARAKDVDEVKKIRDQAAAVRVYYRQRKAAISAQNDASEIVIWTDRRLGELTRALPKARGGRGKTGLKAGPVPPKKEALALEGVSKQQANRWEQLAAVPEAKLRAHIAAVRARNERVTTSGAIAAVSLVAGYDGDEFGSPDEILDAARRVLDRIDLDPASNPAAQRRVRARKFYAKRDNGLTKRWAGTVWLNPPFSTGLVKAFVGKLLGHVDSDDVSAALVLLNADTSTATVQALVDRGYEFCLTNSRLAFLGPDGKVVDGNRSGQIIFYIGTNPARFRKEFRAFGAICKVVQARKRQEEEEA